VRAGLEQLDALGDDAVEHTLGPVGDAQGPGVAGEDAPREVRESDRRVRRTEVDGEDHARERVEGHTGRRAPAGRDGFAGRMHEARGDQRVHARGHGGSCEPGEEGQLGFRARPTVPEDLEDLSRARVGGAQSASRVDHGDS